MTECYCTKYSVERTVVLPLNRRRSGVLCVHGLFQYIRTHEQTKHLMAMAQASIVRFNINDSVCKRRLVTLKRNFICF